MSASETILYWSQKIPVPTSVLARLNISATLFSELKGLNICQNDVLVVSLEEATSALKKNKIPARWLLWNETDTAVDKYLLNWPNLVGVIDNHCSDDVVFMVLRGLLQQPGGDSADSLKRILEVGRALASEKDLDTLFDLILSHARSLTNSDGASIYTRDDDGKIFLRYWQNASIGHAAAPQKIPVGDDSAAGCVARNGETLDIPDAYAIPENSPYKFNPASDQKICYHTQSILTVPMKNKADEVVGVLQLINRKKDPQARLKTEKDCHRCVMPFDESDRQVAEALAGQAGVALENSILYADIEKLFEGFIRASVHAIESRDPTTAGHSFRVAEFTERLARAVDHTDLHNLKEISFTKDELREIRYASLLHDFGKVGVKEDVLVKAKKLYPYQMEEVQQRIKLARVSVQRKAFAQMVALHDNQKLSSKDRTSKRQQLELWLANQLTSLDQYLQIVVTANEPAVSHAEVSSDLEKVINFRFPNENDEPVALLNEFEFADLSLAKGSLNSDERKEIESHVSHTFDFLSLIPWTKNLANLPGIAYGHHEKLDGSGYPRGLAASEISIGARMMTISDIYDALTAMDRPYKKALPVERALDILGYEAKEGKIDTGLLDIFIQSRAFAPIT